ncbi:45305_t:CDS:2 [Gigaspora margarita]|uniref:45305_t:CDS:1 n=1 Tax=Gigaspora margarita TaxID=4874 RepID=A0ABN7V6T1_GIGMA|nr:45305_t:CDS:2 [Gigaspora margarita]
MVLKVTNGAPNNTKVAKSQKHITSHNENFTNTTTMVMPPIISQPTKESHDHHEITPTVNLQNVEIAQRRQEWNQRQLKEP